MNDTPAPGSAVASTVVPARLAGPSETADPAQVSTIVVAVIVCLVAGRTLLALGHTMSALIEMARQLTALALRTALAGAVLMAMSALLMMSVLR